RGLLPVLPRTLAVLAVVGDVETRALEDEARPAGDLPGGGLAAGGALGARLVRHLLEQLELMSLGTEILVCRHRLQRPKRNGRNILAEAARRFKPAREAALVPADTRHD